MLNKLLTIIFIIFIPLWCGAFTESYTFENGTNEAACEGATGFDGAGTTTTFSTTMAHSGTKSAKFVHPVGQDDWDEATGIIGIPNVAEEGEIWIRWYDYMVPTWNWAANPVVKVMRIGTYNTSNVGEGWLSVFAHHDDGMIMLSNEPDGIQTNSTTPFTEGAWTCYEMYVKLHATDGQGIFRIWKNGELIHNDTTNATLNNATDTAQIVYVWSYWNGNVPATQTDYLDDLIITNEQPANQDANGYYMIGPSDWGGTDTTAPTISNVLPTTQQTCSTNPRNVTRTWNTNEASTCRIHATSSTWAEMAEAGTTGGTNHSSTASQACDASYTPYIVCQDGATNESTPSQMSYSIAAEEASEKTATVEIGVGDKVLYIGNNQTPSIGAYQ
jgi:hypothetical protein